MLRYLIDHLYRYNNQYNNSLHSQQLNILLVFHLKMKASTVLGLFIAYAATTSAIPVKQRDQEVEITFVGAADAQFTQSIPTDGSIVSIGTSLGISYIWTETILTFFRKPIEHLAYLIQHCRGAVYL